MEAFSFSCWAYGSVWFFFICLGLQRFSNSAIVLTPALLVYCMLIVLLEWLCHVYLPTALGIFLLSGACWYVLGVISPRKMLPVSGKAVLITGCDSGFGQAVAYKLDSMGFQVVATVLNIDGPGAKELQQMCSNRLKLIQVDLTKPKDIQKALELTKTQIAGRGLWGLVNNAGICVHFGDAELSLMSNYRGCMEVNFFGTLEITKAFLPLLRCSKGRIVTISSPAGDQPFPFLAAYGSSKAALTRVMDTFRFELECWGVKVSIIQPGCYKTGPFNDLSRWEHQHEHHLASLPEELLQDYGEEYVSEIKRLFLKIGDMASEDLAPVVECITDALLAAEPKVRYFTGKGLWLIYFIGNHMPFFVSDRFFRGFFLNNKVIPRALHKQQKEVVEE
ncbi:11-beta-hydroxysteroid dehydrogenase type 2 isoform X1 [Microcaecilia unicolor]|uniref:11-beta-hydroxysteroid dehydrogenase type 2 n=1 Tax=Microcaecilia unicolor TaxID=1415580 RepID=A0A6P7XVT4_9AMPH|nr:corticosteroid 11-beta-dehydrogenase isozyme 2 isoform X1 [Microcaecilia unicolor]